MSSQLQDRVYIVTGASSGFGLAIARDLVERGAKVGLVARSSKKLQSAVDELGENQAYAVTADIADSAAVARAFAAIKARFGRLDGLINNAGIARPDRIENIVDSELQAQVDTNFVGLVTACRAAIPLLKGGDNPRIINMSSASAHHRDEMVWLSVYAATKAAVERFTRDLRNEVREQHIGVTILRPGAAETDFASAWQSNKFVAAVNQWHDLGPIMDTGMEARHVAEAVAWCLSADPGVSVDLLEIRPNRPAEKPKY